MFCEFLTTFVKYSPEKLAVGGCLCDYQLRSVPESEGFMSEAVELQWFVARTRAKQEKAVKEQIEALGWETFLPVRRELKKWSDRMKKVDTVLLPNTVFIRATRKETLDLHNVHGIAISFVRDVTHIRPTPLMIIPDKQMEDFRHFIEASQGQYEVEKDIIYQKGDAVIVTAGPFKGIVGELLRIDGHNKVLVRLGNLITCSTSISMDQLEKINDLV